MLLDSAYAYDEMVQSIVMSGAYTFIFCLSLIFLSSLFNYIDITSFANMPYFFAAIFSWVIWLEEIQLQVLRRFLVIWFLRLN